MSDMPAIYMMPLPPEEGRFAHECYMKFMRHMNRIKGADMDHRILRGIQFTADMTDNSTAHIAQLLVEMGLRAPQNAFPQDFIDYMEERRDKPAWMLGAPTRSQIELDRFWATGTDALNQTMDRSAHARERSLQELASA